MKDKHPKLGPIMKLRTEEPDSYYREAYAHIRIEFCYREDGELNFYRDYDYEDGEMDLYNLQISNQIDGQERDYADDTFSYAWRLSYGTVNYVELEKAERMAKTLRLINRRYDALTKKLGEPRSFGHYVAYIADCMKIREIALPSTYGWQEPNIVDIATGIYRINKTTQQLRKLCLEKTRQIAV